MIKNRLYTIQDTPLKYRIYLLVRGFVLWFMFAAIANLILSYMLYTPKSYLINRDNLRLQQQLEQTKIEMSSLDIELERYRFRYNTLYKSILGINTESNNSTTTQELYPELRKDRYRSFLEELNITRDNLEHSVATLSLSLDTVSVLTQNKNLILTALPTISPINKNDINYISDKFGWRFHPTLKRNKFHEGLDLSCKRGTSVYSTASGVVKRVRYDGNYGWVVDVDHGFGYVTRYAHLTKAVRKVGDRVARGEMIALSGSTGRSTGPHLHYEVIVNGKRVDPLFYMSTDMTEEEFARIIETAQVGGDILYDINNTQQEALNQY